MILHNRLNDPVTPDCQHQIVTASLRDLSQVKILEKVCFPIDAWPLLDLIGVLSLPNIIRLKAVCGDKLVGFVAADIRRSDNTSWIATIGVLPEYRGRGIGQALLKACEALIPTESIRLCVRLSNTPAIEMYKSSGYTYVGNWAGYYQDGEDALVMGKVQEIGL